MRSGPAGETIKYFAYGSNMHPRRLLERTPSIVPVGPALLPGYDLKFHKRSDNPTDLSGKCDIEVAARGDAAVFGVVYEMAAEERDILDAAEGPGYGVETLAAHAADQTHEVFAYVARDTHIVRDLKPYAWYRELVIRGARAHGLPAEYVAAIAGIETIDDHHVGRAARFMGLAWSLGSEVTAAGATRW